MVRFILVGTGSISGTYVTSCHKTPGASIVGVVSRSGRCPSNLSVPVYASLAEVSVEFDAVIICTPNGTHCQIVEEAAGMGKHSLVEKPLDITSQACDRLVATAKKHNVQVGVTFQRRFSPDNLAVKKLLDSGALGQVIAADLTAKFFRDQAYYDQAPYRGGYAIDGGGPFIQQAVHNIDIMCWFFGMPNKVQSMLGTFMHDIEAEDHGVAMLRYPNGMIGSIVASTCAAPGFPARLDINTTKGSFVLVNDVITEWHIQGVDNPKAKTDFQVHAGASSAKVTDTAGHEAVVRDFVSALTHKRAPYITAESARLATDLIVEIYRNGASTHHPKRGDNGEARSAKRQKFSTTTTTTTTLSPNFLSAFADEAADSLDDQLTSLRKGGMSWIDLRNVDGVNVSALKLSHARAIRAKLDAAGVRVSMLGSPIGKVSLDEEAKTCVERLQHLAVVSNIVGCNRVRIFSYYNSKKAPLGESEWRAESLKRLHKLKAEADRLGMVLFMENEPGLFGDTLVRVRSLLAELRDANASARVFGSIFDLDNFLQAGENVWLAWEALRDQTDAFHLKESKRTEGGSFEHVPLGEGDCSARRILADARERGYNGLLSLEPHLSHSPAVLTTGPHGSANRSLKELGPSGTFQVAADAAVALLASL